jgi:hypothetical protein
MLYTAQGNLEPLLVVLALGAAEAWLAGRPRLCLGLLLALALARPEAWPLLAALGLALWRSEPGLRLELTAAALSVPMLWFGPDWLSAGEPLAGGGVARNSPEALALQSREHPLVVVLARMVELLPAALWASFALLPASRGTRGRLGALGDRAPALRTVALACLTWLGAVLALSAVGYAGLGRFSLPAAAVAGALGAGAAVWLLGTLEARARLVAGAAAGTLLAISVVPRLAPLDDPWREAAQRAQALDTLEGSVDRAGGRRLVGRCGHVAVEGPFHTALAWRYGLAITQLGDLGRVARPVVVAAHSRSGWRVRAAGCSPRAQFEPSRRGGAVHGGKSTRRD